MSDMFDALNAYCSVPIPKIDYECGCDEPAKPYRPLSALPANATVTMAYVPFQESTEMYDNMKGLSKGTIFPVLDKPFLGKDWCNG